jgi:nucleotide-binding universal stress UspA family protein
MKKVLITIDYSPTAKKVAEEGYSLAKSMKAKVILLHVINDPVYYASEGYSPIMGYTGYVDVSPMQLDDMGLIKASKKYLEKSKLHLGDKSIETIVKEGDFADAILLTAKEIDADIIVMGSHSRRWLEQILIGSVTEKVLHHTTIPLFIVPTKKTE